MANREELAKAIQIEMEERGKRCMDRIQVILMEEHCQLVANVEFQEAAPGKFCIVANPGVRPQ